jgi:hypothetical protein
MGFAGIVRSGVKLADKLTTDLQIDMRHARYVTEDFRGDATYATPVIRKALVERKLRMVKTISGEMAASSVTLTFLRPLLLDVRDKLTFPDDSTGKIIAEDGLVDPATNMGYFSQVSLE